MPRRARGGDIAYLKRTIPYFYSQGARFMNSENRNSWGANGLGYYLSPRFLWSVREVNNARYWIDDFLDKCFGPAKKPMRRFYTLLNLDKSLHSPEHVVACMYRSLAEARRLTDDPAIRTRLNDLVLYAHYVELYDSSETSGGQQRQKAFEAVARHAWRMRGTLMISYGETFVNLPRRDKSLVLPAEAAFDVPEGRNPWKSGKPFDQQEIDSILKAGIAANKVTKLGFKFVEFSEHLVPADRLNLPAVTAGSFGRFFRGNQKVYTWLPPANAKLDFKVTGGRIYQDRGNVKISLFADEEATLRAVAQDESIVPDKKEHTVSLTSPYGGLHTLQWSDGGAGTNFAWPDGLPMTLQSSMAHPAELEAGWSLYFYVPRGTRVIGGYADSRTGRLRDGIGCVVFRFSRMERLGYFNLPVPTGQDGKLWKFEGCSGRRVLLTVPPYLARTAKELLLPREVVEADTGK